MKKAFILLFIFGCCLSDSALCPPLLPLLAPDSPLDLGGGDLLTLAGLFRLGQRLEREGCVDKAMEVYRALALSPELTPEQVQQLFRCGRARKDPELFSCLAVRADLNSAQLDELILVAKGLVNKFCSSHGDWSHDASTLWSKLAARKDLNDDIDNTIFTQIKRLLTNESCHYFSKDLCDAIVARIDLGRGRFEFLLNLPNEFEGGKKEMLLSWICAALARRSDLGASQLGEVFTRIDSAGSHSYLVCQALASRHDLSKDQVAGLFLKAAEFERDGEVFILGGLYSELARRLDLMPEQVTKLFSYALSNGHLSGGTCAALARRADLSDGQIGTLFLRVAELRRTDFYDDAQQLALALSSRDELSCERLESLFGYAEIPDRGRRLEILYSGLACRTDLSEEQVCKVFQHAQALARSGNDCVELIIKSLARRGDLIEKWGDKFVCLVRTFLDKNSFKDPVSLFQINPCLLRHSVYHLVMKSLKKASQIRALVNLALARKEHSEHVIFLEKIVNNAREKIEPSSSSDTVLINDNLVVNIGSFLGVARQELKLEDRSAPAPLSLSEADSTRRDCALDLAKGALAAGAVVAGLYFLKKFVRLVRH